MHQSAAVALCVVLGRDRHGLGPSMGWVGSHFQAHVMGWVGLSEKYCYFVYCVLCLLQYYVLRKFANKCLSLIHI